MRFLMRYPVMILLSLVLLVGQLSCAHIPRGIPTPTKSLSLSGEVKAEIGTIGIASARYKPECKVSPSVVKGWGSGASMGAAGGALEGATVGLLYPFTDPQALLFLPIVLPISVLVGTVAGALIGATTGAFQGVPKSKAEEAVVAVKNATDELKVQKVMQENILTIVREQTGYQFLVIEDQGPIDINDEPTYVSLTGKGIDVILETNVWSYGLWGQEGINPPLHFFVNVSARLIRVRDGKVLYSRNLRRESVGRKFIDWGANNAQPFREELDFCCHSLAKQIIKDIFLPLEL
jgi:hypothetical protein